jgi:hypothetical protein
MQGWFNTGKFINVIQHINNIGKNLIIISKDGGKTLTKLNILHNKKPEEIRNRRNVPEHNKGDI